MIVDPVKRKQMPMAVAVSESGQGFFMSNVISMKGLVEEIKTVFVSNVAESAGGAAALRLIARSMRSDDIDLQTISSGDRELHLARPLHVSVDFRDDLWVMENKELGVISMSPDYDQCLQEFNSEILFLRREYGEADDLSLTLDAKALKSKVLDYIQPQNDL